MRLVTRNSDLSIEKIFNGFILTVSGRNSQGTYLTDNLFVDDLTEVNTVVSDYFNLPEDT